MLRDISYLVVRLMWNVSSCLSRSFYKLYDSNNTNINYINPILSIYTKDVPRSFEGIKDYLQKHFIEGLYSGGMENQDAR